MSDKKLGDGGKSHRYKLLNDVQWLHDRYVVEGLSTKKIAKLVGAKTPNSVRQALQRASIEIRSVSDGLTINREDDGFVLRKDVIEGGLLGDAGLRIWNKHSDASYPSYTRKNKYKDHASGPHRHHGRRPFRAVSHRQVVDDRPVRLHVRGFRADHAQSVQLGRVQL